MDQATFVAAQQDLIAVIELLRVADKHQEPAVREGRKTYWIVSLPENLKGYGCTRPMILRPRVGQYGGT
jgi:hypothetical protein